MVAQKVAPAVYRRRRLVVFLGGIVAVLLVFWGVGALVGAVSGALKGDASQTAQVHTSSNDATGKSETSTVAECGAAHMVLGATTNMQSYRSGQDPVFSLTITNTGKAPCRMNMGTSQMEFLVTNGAERIFSSRDCQEGAKDLFRILEPGTSERANFPWRRNRSNAACSVENSPIPVGAYARYELVIKLGNLPSAKQNFTLLS